MAMKSKHEKTAELFKAFSDPTRLKIFELLSGGEVMLCVTALAARLGVSQPAVSQHLRVLRHAGILQANRTGCEVHYSIDKKALGDFQKTITAMYDNAISTPIKKCSGKGKGECKSEKK